ncbi:MAG: glycoside hydrolase family 13 protein [Lachnospiraceae bacterium]|nr:glycoside hydrolase family 13 protein [Lachnospiraceae bacterium]
MDMYKWVEGLSEKEMKRIYMLTMTPTLHTRGIFSDVTADYVSPLEPEPYSHLTIRFRAEKNNLSHVFLVYKEDRILMDLAESEGLFDYYEAKITIDNAPVRYHFYFESGRTRAFYDRRGVVKDEQEYFDFCIYPGFSVPSWSRGAVIYQIYTDRFCNGDPSNDVLDREYYYINGYSEHAENWEDLPHEMDVRRFYGGDLKGVMDKLPYLKSLGIDVIYFNPLFVSPSNHRYDIQDYDHIDPHIGRIVEDGGALLPEGVTDNREAERYKRRVTSMANLEASNALFAELTAKCHELGIRVIIDGVFNHCGSFNKWLDRERIYEGAAGFEPGAYVTENSPYHDFFRFHGGSFPYNGTYDGWWGHDTLPKLNYEGSKELEEYILRIAAKWVSPPYNCDGWRLDVAADLGHSPEYNHLFWQKFRKAVKTANRDAVIIAEHYGDASEWLRGNEWDSVMNYDAFMEPVTWFLTGMQKHSDDFREDLLGNSDAFFSAMFNNNLRFTEPSAITAMNELSNHDHSRFLTRTNHKVGRLNTLGSKAADEGVDMAVMREAVLMQFTWPGCPTIYYGDEAGLTGFTDPDNRRSYPWGNENFELIDYHRALIRIHRECPELREGSLKKLLTDYALISYARFTREYSSIIIVNNNNTSKEMEISVWETGLPLHGKLRRLILTYEDSFTTEPFTYEVKHGYLHIYIQPKSAMIVRGCTRDNI